MSKPRFVISCPFDTYSGYGARSRDIVKAIIELDKYNVELLPQKWGSTTWGFCKDHPEWEFLMKHVAKPNWQQTKPEIWMQITIPNEFQPIGKYNIGCTAGIETTSAQPQWIEGLNRMNMNWVSSKHSKKVFEDMAYEKKHQETGQILGVVKNTKPIHVIFEGANLDIYKPLKEKNTFDLSNIKESFGFLFVGHWMEGAIGHDRKNVGLMIKSFFETFKNKKRKPALILKASIGVDSHMSRNEILDRILKIRKSVNSKDLPNVYLITGKFSDEDMNQLYNHSKVKAMISLTKGEGYGRPLLEFSLTKKPIIASGWSGQTDFLHKSFTTLLPGKLEKVHPSAANKWIMKEAEWFQANPANVGLSLNDMFNNYKKYKLNAVHQSKYSKSNFSFDKMKELVGNVLAHNVPDFPTQVGLDLPELDLPKLEKV